MRDITNILTYQVTHIVTAVEDNVTDTQCSVMLSLLSLDKD